MDGREDWKMVRIGTFPPWTSFACHAAQDAAVKERLITKIAAFALLVLIAVPALAQSLGEKTGINAALSVAPTTADFVKQVAISDMFETQSSKLAAQQTDGPTKDFANHMDTDHGKTSSELKHLVAGDLNIPMPTAMDDAHQT